MVVVAAAVVAGGGDSRHFLSVSDIAAMVSTGAIWRWRTRVDPERRANARLSASAVGGEIGHVWV